MAAITLMFHLLCILKAVIINLKLQRISKWKPREQVIQGVKEANTNFNWALDILEV